MSRITKQITQDLEEHLINFTTLSMSDDKSNRSFLNYRLSLFKIILFTIIHKKIKLLKNNLIVNSQIIKNTMVMFNNMVEDLNNSFLTLRFEKFNLELTKPITISVSNKKSPYKNILQRFENLEDINPEDEKTLLCKPLTGLLAFIVFHKTKTKRELSINVMSEIKSKNKVSDFRDVTEIIFMKNHYILKELDILVNTYLTPKLKHEIWKDLTGTDKTFESIESDMYYGFIASLTLNTEGEEDVNDVLDMLYYPDKPYKPYIKLYYEIYQYKKASTHFIYRNITDVPNERYNTIIKQEDVLYDSLAFKHKICLSLTNNTIDFKVQTVMSIKIQSKQKCDTVSDSKVNIAFTANKKNFDIYLSSKDILYHNIDVNSEVNICNGKYILPKHVLFTKDLVLKNSLFSTIRDKYVLTNNNILIKKNEKYIDHGLNLLFKINQSHIPWNEFNKFLQSYTEPATKQTTEDIFKLLTLFRQSNPKTGKLIIDKLIYMSLSDMFNDIYQTDSDMCLKEFKKFYEKNFFIDKDWKIKQMPHLHTRDNTIIEEQKTYFKDFLFVLEIIFLLIKNN